MNKQDVIGVSGLVAALFVGINFSWRNNLNFSPLEHLSAGSGFLAGSVVFGLVIGLIAHKLFSQQLLAATGVATLLLSFGSLYALESRPKSELQPAALSYEQCVLDKMKHQPGMNTLLGYAIKVCQQEHGIQR